MLIRKAIFLSVVVLLLAGGCRAGSEAGESPERTPGPDATSLPAGPTVTARPESGGTPIEPTEESEEEIMTPTSPRGREGLPQVEMAVADLAERLDVAAEQIEVVDVEFVTWPDGSLGCPQPGMAYTQVPQDGLLIRLEAGGETYAYHSGGGRDPFLCEQAAAPQKSTPIFDEEDVLTRTGSEEE